MTSVSWARGVRLTCRRAFFFTKSLNIFSDPFEKGFEAVIPDTTIPELQRLNDQILSDGFIITNGGPLNATLSIVQLLYRHAFVNLEFGYGSAIATFLLVVLVAVALVNRRVHDLIVQ